MRNEKSDTNRVNRFIHATDFFVVLTHFHISASLWKHLNVIECDYSNDIQHLTTTHVCNVAVYIEFDLRWTHHSQLNLSPVTVLVGIEVGSTLNYLEIYHF